jgi:hypothetical protein
MRPLGYVLLAFNLLAGGAFVYFAAQDWRGRQDITASGLRHILLVRGLPYDGPEDVSTDPDAAIPFRVEMAGGAPTDTVSPKFLDSYLRDAPPDGKSPLFATPTVVASQRGELKRVRESVKRAYSTATPDLKLRLLEGWLQYQVETYYERTVVQQLVGQKDVARLAVMLDLRFQQVNPKLLNSADDALEPEEWTKIADRISEAEAKAKTAEDEAARLDREAAGLLSRAADAEDDLKVVLKGGKANKINLQGVKGPERIPVAPDEELRDLIAVLPFEASQKTREAVRKRQRAAELIAEANLLRPPAAQGEAQLKTRLAHLLVHLDTDPAWQKRVTLVVGLRQYVKTVGAQALRFRTMVGHVDRLIAQDQKDYDSDMALLRGVAIQRTEMVRKVVSVREGLEQQRDREVRFLAQRQTQLDTIAKWLEEVRAEVSDLLTKQATMEKELYTLQKDIAVTLDDVYDLQEQLEAAERQRFAPAPPGKQIP